MSSIEEKFLEVFGEEPDLIAAAPGRDWLFEAGRARLKKKEDISQADHPSTAG